MTKRIALLLAALALAFTARPVLAGEVDKDVPFALDQWIDLKVTDGPVTLHRIRITRQSGITKSKFLRPGNSEYLQDVQIQINFSNDSSKDWEARIKLEWLDGSGDVIDGYNDKESLDSDSRDDDQTITLSTLKYGLERAKKLKLHISFNRD